MGEMLIMKLLILGPSQSGKTTLAKQIAQTYGFAHISASEWIKQSWPPSPEDFPHRNAYIQAITDYSLTALRQSPHACIDYIRDRLPHSGSTVIDGIRNPHDFIHLFDWQSDRCLSLIYQHCPVPSNEFEQGLVVIEAYLNWLLTNRLIQHSQAIAIKFQAFQTNHHTNSLEAALPQIHQWLQEPI